MVHFDWPPTGFHLPFDQELCQHLVYQYLDKDTEQDGFVWDRFVGYRTLVLLSSRNEVRDQFINVLIKRLRENQLDANCVSLLTGCLEHFPPNQRTLIEKELATYLGAALLILERIDRIDGYRVEFSEAYKNTITRFKEIDLFTAE